jgi:hypothetical protein
VLPVVEVAPMPRNPRRAYDSEGQEFEPMPLSNMREHGVRSVEAECRDCKREALVNVDSLSDALPVPDVALRLRCSACGSKNIATRPNWREHKRNTGEGWIAARTDARAIGLAAFPLRSTGSLPRRAS